MLRDKTPQKNNGTVGSDVVKMVRTFRTGIEVQVQKVVPSLFVAKQPDYGYRNLLHHKYKFVLFVTFFSFCEAPLGKLSQEPAQLEENLQSLLETLRENRPKREKGGFITRVSLEMLEGPHYASFSIRHPLIDDEKWEKHLKTLDQQQSKN